MIDWLLLLARENPILFFVVMVNISISVGLISYLAFTYLKRRGIKLKIPKFQRKVSFSLERKSIDELCKFVLNQLGESNISFLARRRALFKAPEEKRKILERIFSLYEDKVYGKKNIGKEEVERLYKEWVSE